MVDPLCLDVFWTKFGWWARRTVACCHRWAWRQSRQSAFAGLLANASLEFVDLVFGNVLGRDVVFSVRAVLATVAKEVEANATSLWSGFDVLASVFGVPHFLGDSKLVKDAAVRVAFRVFLVVWAFLFLTFWTVGGRWVIVGRMQNSHGGGKSS